MTTTGSESEAETLAEALIRHRLAGCVQLSPIVSHYLWQGEPMKSNEVLVLIKASVTNVAGIISYIETYHSYAVPEVIELPIASGSSAYLAWLDQPRA